MSTGPAVDALGPSEPGGEPESLRRPDEAVAATLDWGPERRRRTMPAGPRLGLIGWLRWSWRQLTSMRTALILLLLLAVAAIPGSVLPQRPTDPLAVNDWIAANPRAAGVLDRLGLFSVFSSPWFSAIYILLFVSLIGCVLPRTSAHWRAMRAAPAAPRRLDRVPGARSWLTDDPDALTNAAAALRADRWLVVRAPAGPVGWLAAEKGYARESGNLLFHVALVLLLVGVALGGLFGWKGTVIVREGSGFANTLTQYDTFSPARLATGESLPPFSFTLTDFEATFEREGSQRGAPRSFAAQLEYRAAPGEAVQSRTVSVNSPLRVDGAKVFLVGHGYAPHLRIADSTGRVVFDDTVVFLPQDGDFTSTGVVKSPDGTPQLGIEALFLPTAALDDVLGPHSTFPAPDDPALFASVWTGDLGLDSGLPSNVFTLDTGSLDRLGIAALRPGESWEIPGGRGKLQLVGYDRWASFTISHDPGKLLALAAATLAVIGLSLSLFVRRRRIWVQVTSVPADGAAAAPDGSAGQLAASDRAGSLAAFRVAVAGMSRTETGEVDREVQQLVASLGGSDAEEAL
ncbi:MAG: cytochrome c biogenesis protein ResB [Candidatus Nanopelagicales bacterium]